MILCTTPLLLLSRPRPRRVILKIAQERLARPRRQGQALIGDRQSGSADSRAEAHRRAHSSSAYAAANDLEGFHIVSGFAFMKRSSRAKAASISASRIVST